MSDYEQSLIFYAQKYIVFQLKKKASKKITDLMWGSTSLNLGPDEYGLTIQKIRRNWFSLSQKMS